MTEHGKKSLYCTAKSTIACAYFKAGEFVSVEYSHTAVDGVDWYTIRRSENYTFLSAVAYPSHHLTEFCL